MQPQDTWTSLPASVSLHSLVIRTDQGFLKDEVPQFCKQVEKFKYLGVAFTSDGRQDEELDTRIGKANELELGKLMYKIHNGLVPTAVKEEFIASTSLHNHNTRLQKKENYYLSRAKTPYGQKNIGV